MNKDLRRKWLEATVRYSLFPRKSSGNDVDPICFEPIQHLYKALDTGSDSKYKKDRPAEAGRLRLN